MLAIVFCCQSHEPNWSHTYTLIACAHPTLNQLWYAYKQTNCSQNWRYGEPRKYQPWCAACGMLCHCAWPYLHNILTTQSADLSATENVFKVMSKACIWSLYYNFKTQVIRKDHSLNQPACLTAKISSLSQAQACKYILFIFHHVINMAFGAWPRN